MSRPGAELKFAEIEARLGGRLGVAALDTGSGKQLSYRRDERFAMCSTFKSLLVANVLSHVEKGWLSLDQRVPYSIADLIEHSPFMRDHLAEGSVPVADLCGATIEISDNTAANLLLSLIGGPPGLTDYLRRLGDPITRLDRTELSLNSNIRGDDRDTTTPDAMIRTMSKILVGDVLSPGARTRLVNWMKNCRTGFSRLRAGLPQDWIVGDKTGTGSNGAANDTAILWPPGRAPIMVAAYLSESANPPEDLNAAHAKIGSIVAAVFA
ncbi:MAG: class A beta-lactamase [Candidatus Binatus sp.]|jgi:beta-lactamase class A|uniref:class A beta-lactamase n=1 Tax=Candidatus Binatus sp. TaxID=2811406 RepID=UPI003C707384